MLRCLQVLGFLSLGAALVACGPLANSPQPSAQVQAAASATASQPGLMVQLDAEKTTLVGRVGDRLGLWHRWYMERDAQGGLVWSVLTPDTAALDGADGVRLLAPGAVRVRARQGQRHKDFLLAALPQAPEAVDLGSVPGPSWQPDATPPVLSWLRGEGDWQAWMSALPPNRREAPPSAWALPEQDLLVVQVVWGNTNEKAPVVLTHRDATGLWNVVVCNHAPVIVLPMMDFTQRAFLLPKEAGPLRLRWHDARGDRLEEAVKPEAAATPAFAAGVL